jgi:two-component system cell cycle response regulator
MTPASESDQTPTGAPGPPRLVLVGRTGLDERLREGEFQLVRARSGLDAIGALAGDGAQAVILGEGSGAEGATETRQMIEAMRRVRPGVRVLSSSAANGAAGAADATVRPEDPIAAIRSVIRGGTPASAAAPTPPAPPVASPTAASGAGRAAAIPAPASLPVAAGDPAFADAELARALTRGLDILGPAMEILRRRSGDPGLRFVPRPADSSVEPVAGANRSGAGADVLCAGQRAGRLLSDRLPEGKLAGAAEWLGSWLMLRDQHAQLREAAFTDSLTGAWNRRYFERFLETALREARRDRHEVTLLVFDIDDFKRYNDAYGHGAGDDVLIETARLMRSVVRPSDRVCRIGGDEFAVVFNEPQGPREPGSQRPTSIMQIAERFQRQIALARFPKLGEAAPGPLTVSGGLASFPWDGHDVATLLRIADGRALASKRQGKNAITFGQ